MKKLSISGLSGFIGKNFHNKFNNIYNITNLDRKILNDINNICFNEIDSVIHFAGISKDIQNYSKEYYRVNTQLTVDLFNLFINSNAKKFIFLSTIKTISDNNSDLLTEDLNANPMYDYGKSKLLAENYLLSQNIPNNKKFYILRPTLIHGVDNKGNLNLLYKFISKKLPWPLGAYENKRSYCSIDNLLFIIQELIERDDIPSGIYNICDNDPISTNELVEIISNIKMIKPKILKIPKIYITLISNIGTFLNLPFNNFMLEKLTNSCIVSNKKILSVIKKELPLSSKEGLFKTFSNNL